MTNEEIIEQNANALMNEGKLKGVLIGNDEDGNEVFVPEVIHTYQAWKKLGYQVKKKEKAIACFKIWKQGKKEVEKEKADENGVMKKVVEKVDTFFLVNSSFFKSSQVEKIPQATEVA